MSTRIHPKSRQLLCALSAVLIGVSLSACDSVGDELNGRWISSVMGDTFDCQGNLNTLVIDNDRITVYVAGQVVKQFEGLKTTVAELKEYDGVRGLLKSSDTAQFLFALEDHGNVNLLMAVPPIARSVLNSPPNKLMRCP